MNKNRFQGSDTMKEDFTLSKPLIVTVENRSDKFKLQLCYV
jgi:hypothetical protein